MKYLNKLQLWFSKMCLRTQQLNLGNDKQAGVTKDQPLLD